MHQKGKLLYFAPESNIDYLQTNDGLEIKTSNYPDGEADLHLDIMNMSIPDNSFDYIICHRVIEHLPDDRYGMKEFYRILKPGGIAVISVPINLDMQESIEYGEANPLENEHFYHYGLDFSSRIPQEFVIQSHKFTDTFSESEFDRLSLLEDYIFVCKKPPANE
ncbi:hypothetical protein BOW53_12145 [Solemya pervernicosa gill symbiont]|uniref:Methyltransferase type 11 domain-containing protein n=2 Tax=Solemya pervernicosa gill symbiont TaxID=642797 RepID=A0A1T2L2I9_9GAMM|nr:hypothetical protein BOW53_12145 [Solemya pervernicosa gill symbiont]